MSLNLIDKPQLPTPEQCAPSLFLDHLYTNIDARLNTRMAYDLR